MSEATAKRHMGLKTSRAISNTAIHVLLIVISIIWLIPFVCIVLQSFRVENTGPVGYVVPKIWGTDNYVRLFETDFPRWYTNTFICALATAVLQTIIVLCMSYTLSRFRFKMRKPLMRFMLILGMFPGMLSMIILYRVLKDLGLTQANAVPGLILVYVASSGMGYYVSKGFFDTIPMSLDEAARVDGATRAKILYKTITCLQGILPSEPPPAKTWLSVCTTGSTRTRSQTAIPCSAQAACWSPFPSPSSSSSCRSTMLRVLQAERSRDNRKEREKWQV